jgi:hypothetical protein
MTRGSGLYGRRLHAPRLLDRVFRVSALGLICYLLRVVVALMAVCSISFYILAGRAPVVRTEPPL